MIASEDRGDDGSLACLSLAIVDDSSAISNPPYFLIENQRIEMKRTVFLLLSLLVSAESGSLLMDSSGGLRLKIPSISTGGGVVSVISSPGTRSLLSVSDEVLSLESEDPPCLACRGATLSGTSPVERSALATCSVVSGAILVDGITEGDVEAGWRNSRHARTLTALFRARISLDMSSKQTLVLCIKGEIDASAESALRAEVKALFDATAAESEGKIAFSNFYDVSVVSVYDEASAKEVGFSRT
jgi:hypothetical protein